MSFLSKAANKLRIKNFQRYISHVNTHITKPVQYTTKIKPLTAEFTKNPFYLGVLAGVIGTTGLVLATSDDQINNNPVEVTKRVEISPTVSIDDKAIDEKQVERKEDNTENEKNIEEKKEETPKENSEEKEKKHKDSEDEDWWIGMNEFSTYLNQESIKRIEERLGLEHDENREMKAVLLLKPKPDDANFMGHWLGNEIDIKIVAIIEDENAKVLFTRAVSPIPAMVRYPYIVIKAPNNQLSPYSEEGYPTLLIDRFLSAGLLEMTGEGVEEQLLPKNKDWEGELDTYYAYPKTKAKLTNIVDENIVVRGVVCSDIGYKHNERKCVDVEHEVQCAFCVFMRSGPCREEFLKWQRVMDNLKEDDDLITIAGPSTLELKNCTEKYSYYDTLTKEAGKVTDEDVEKAKNEQVRINEMKKEEKENNNKPIKEEKEEKEELKVEEEMKNNDDNNSKNIAIETDFPIPPNYDPTLPPSKDDFE